MREGKRRGKNVCMRKPYTVILDYYTTVRLENEMSRCASQVNVQAALIASVRY